MRSEPRVNISNPPTMNEVSAASETGVKLKSKEANVTPQHHISSNTSTPNRTIGFKFNKSKKESSATTNPNSNPSSQFASITSTPRKKLERLNYRSGNDILEAYKKRHSCKMISDEVSQIILENDRIYDTFQPVSTSNPASDEMPKRSSILSKKNSINSDNDAEHEINSPKSSNQFFDGPNLDEKKKLEKMSSLSKKGSKEKINFNEDLDDELNEENGKQSLKEKLIKSEKKLSLFERLEDETAKIKKNVKKKKIIFV